MEATDESNQGMDTAGITLPLEELTVADEYLDEVVEEGEKFQLNSSSDNQLNYAIKLLKI